MRKAGNNTKQVESRAASHNNAVAKPVQAFADNRPESQHQQTVQKMADEHQQKTQHKAVNTGGGLPAQLQQGVEQLSGVAMHDVKVHYNSSKPAQLQALAYAQGNNIHLGPGQEKHLPHEAWHVVQQKQGRVRPTIQMKTGTPVNNDPGLEKEADVMGAKALQTKMDPAAQVQDKTTGSGVVQRLTGFEVELNIPFYGKAKPATVLPDKFNPRQALSSDERRAIGDFLWGGLKYGVEYGKKDGKYDISADHGQFQTAHLEFIAEMTNKGYVTAPGAYDTMTNMEYRTEAQEERDKDSEQKTQEIADEVNNHAVASAAKGTSKAKTALDAPVSGQQTGVPVNALKKLVHGDGTAEGQVDALANAVKPNVYFQTTIGMLPSEIPDAFLEAAKDIGAKNPAKTSRANVSKSILENAVAIARATMQNGAHNALLNNYSKGDKAALTGWLALVSQYFMAYQVETTNYAYKKGGDNKLRQFGGTGKNMVAYLSKTHLQDTISALPPLIRPNVKSGPNKDKWVDLAMDLVTESEKPAYDIIITLGLEDYVGKNYYDDEGNNPKKIKHGEVLGSKKPDEFLLLALSRLSPHHVMTGNTLGLDKGQEKLDPMLDTTGQQAIPLEDRKTKSKESFGNSSEIDKTGDMIKSIWTKAKKRRLHSTTVFMELTGRLKDLEEVIGQDAFNEKLEAVKTAYTNVPDDFKDYANDIKTRAIDAKKANTKIIALKTKVPELENLIGQDGFGDKKNEVGDIYNEISIAFRGKAVALKDREVEADQTHTKIQTFKTKVTELENLVGQDGFDTKKEETGNAYDAIPGPHQAKVLEVKNRGVAAFRAHNKIKTLKTKVTELENLLGQDGFDEKVGELNQVYETIPETYQAKATTLVERGNAAIRLNKKLKVFKQKVIQLEALVKKEGFEAKKQEVLEAYQEIPQEHDDKVAAYMQRAKQAVSNHKK